MLGWRVKISEEDKHELRLDTSEDKNVIDRENRLDGKPSRSYSPWAVVDFTDSLLVRTGC